MTCFQLNTETSADAAAARGLGRFTVMLQDDAGLAVGGLVAGTYGSWLMTRSLWLPVSARHQGLGRALLQLAESEARRRGCKRAFVETSRQSDLPFYERCGYTATRRLPGYAGGSEPYGLTKNLI